jgi:hypothetical protein
MTKRMTTSMPTMSRYVQASCARCSHDEHWQLPFVLLPWMEGSDMLWRPTTERVVVHEGPQMYKWGRSCRDIYSGILSCGPHLLLMKVPSPLKFFLLIATNIPLPTLVYCNHPSIEMDMETLCVQYNFHSLADYACSLLVWFSVYQQSKSFPTPVIHLQHLWYITKL